MGFTAQDTVGRYLAKAAADGIVVLAAHATLLWALSAAENRANLIASGHLVTVVDVAHPEGRHGSEVALLVLRASGAADNYVGVS